MELNSLSPDTGYHTRLLQPPDISALQSLFERARDYFELATGLTPAPDEAQRAFVAGPPTKAVDDKRMIGVFGADDALVGVLDALVDFPGDGEWTMGMLLLDPAHRGSGLGHKLLDEYERWAAQCGARRFHTAVVAHHEPGVRFLESCGYERQREMENYDAGGQRATVVFFSKGAG
jgi:GNAT superfamily N-acetyltransferase